MVSFLGLKEGNLEECMRCIVQGVLGSTQKMADGSSVAFKLNETSC